MNKPRNHHYVPQFWQKQFSAGQPLVWAYDYERDDVRLRSIKTMMEERDLYTVDKFGALDVSLETNELGDVDRDGAKLLQRIVDGEGSAQLRTAFADFLAVQALRVPAMVKRYGELAQALILQFLEAPAAANYADFIARIRAKGGAVLDLDEDGFNTLRTIPLPVLEAFVDAHAEAVASPEGDKDIPHTDAIRDMAARTLITSRFLGMTWTAKRFDQPDLILGDSGVVFEKGSIDGGLRAPLTPTLALFLNTGTEPAPTTISFGIGLEHEAAELNYETAARSTRWLVGASQAVIEAYSRQVRG